MLLQRLVEHAAAHRKSIPFHRERGFTWQLNLNSEGKLLDPPLQNVEQPDAKGKPRPTLHWTPSAVRASGVAPNLTADDVQYVLGWGDETTKPERVRQCHQASIDLTMQWADSPMGRDDPVAQAVSLFYRGNEKDQIERYDDVTAKQGVLIAVDGVPAYQAPSVAAYWVTEIARRKGGGRQGLCLACGVSGPLLDTMPGKIPSRWVPGASNDVALVSVNESVFGYGLQKQLGNTPVCMTCGDAITTGLNLVLDPSNSIAHPGQDSRTSWWVIGDDSLDLIATLEADPAAVDLLYRSLRSGHVADYAIVNETVSRLCSVTVSGNVARLVVRDWVEMPLPEVRQRLRAWFDDHTITSWWGGPTTHALTSLARVTGRWIPGKNKGSYVGFGKTGEQRPAGIQQALYRSALKGEPLPPALLAHLVNRIRNDARLDDPRAALLRLCLTRPEHRRKDAPMPHLDETNTRPAYVAGRAFAVLDAIQYAATEGSTNATFANRHFAGAVANPRAALVSGRRDAAAWLRKLHRDKRGAAVNLEKQLLEVFDKFDGDERNIPASTSLADQALFLIGYHHQRAHHFNTRKETAENTETLENKESQA